MMKPLLLFLIVSLTTNLFSQSQANSNLSQEGIEDMEASSIDPTQLTKLCMMTNSGHIYKYQSSDLLDVLNVLLGVDSKDPDYKIKFERAWSAKKQLLKCDTEELNFETGELFEAQILISSMKEGNRLLLETLMYNFEIDLNVWAYASHLEANQSALEFVIQKLEAAKEHRRHGSIVVYQEVYDRFIELDAKKCSDIPECRNN